MKKWLVTFLSLLYFDLVFNLFTYDNYMRDSIINIFLFDLINSVIIFFLTNYFKDKINKIISYIIYGFLGFWYSLFFIFYKVFATPFSISLFKQTDQVLAFGKETLFSILGNLYMVILFFAPLIILIIYNKKSNHSRRVKINRKSILVYIVLLVICVSIYTINIFVQKRDTGRIYNLYFETNNISLNIQKLGVIDATYIDLFRNIFGFEEKISLVDNTPLEDENEIFDYDYNVLDIEFPSGYDKITNFIKNESGSKQNKYTGMFEGMNLIFVVAESFSEIAVSEELTPTLYKLVHEGFDFKNFYTSNNLSTIGGEFQALTGLYADNGILGSWRSGGVKYPYGFGSLFKSLGYNTYAYHNNSAYFQDRNVYLKNLGFTNFKACYNGLEKIINCNLWPQSDVEMMTKTSSDYINSDKPFMAYYMTVSGHFYYEKSENSMALKNWKYVKDLPYPEAVRGYLATQIELDRAMEVLLKKLEESGKLDNTVIVLLGDHYPYNLSMDDINKLSTYKRDKLVEANSNNLILYNSRMKPVQVDKVGMSIDVLPTVLNLFGVKYDSRIIMGKDILSSTEGIAIFKDKSWVTNKGTYMASTGKFSGTEEVSEDYIKKINSIVSNRVAMSKQIVSNNYYSKLKIK